MPPRSQPLPEATTESAREARRSFFCELCQKGYARMTDFEGHENSYDHQHRKRLKEMRQMTRDPNAAAKARLAEERANEEAGLRTIVGSVELGAGGGGGAAGERKKRPVFKSTLQPHNAVAVTGKPAPPPPPPPPTSAEPVKEKAVEAVRPGQASPLSPSSDPSLPVALSAEMTEDGGMSFDDGMQDEEMLGEEVKEYVISFEIEGEDDEEPTEDYVDEHEWQAERYRPLHGPTELRDIVFVDGRIEVI